MLNIRLFTQAIFLQYLSRFYCRAWVKPSWWTNLLTFSVMFNWPIYSRVLSYLAFECMRGWSWPCFYTDLSAFSFKCQLVSIRTTWFTQQKQWTVCIKTSSPPALLPFSGEVTKQNTVKWSNPIDIYHPSRHDLCSSLDICCYIA